MPGRRPGIEELAELDAKNESTCDLTNDDVFGCSQDTRIKGDEIREDSVCEREDRENTEDQDNWHAA